MTLLTLFSVFEKSVQIKRLNQAMTTLGAKRLFGIFFWGLLPSPALAQLLPYEDVVSNISGEWAVPFEEDGQFVRDCARFTVSIWIEEESVGLVYYSKFFSDEFGDGILHRSPLKQAMGADNNPIPAALIKYDNEERMTEAGALLEWRLYMSADDTFSWQATHWGWDAWTPHRTRCETNSDIS